MSIKQQSIDIIGVMSDLGAGIRGAQLGPKAIRFAGLKDAVNELNYTLNDCGDIVAPNIDTDICGQNTELKNLCGVNAVNNQLFDKVYDSLKKGNFPLVLGGDHAISAGSISAAQKYYGDIGIIWVDAHGDYNTADTTPSGNIHGMPLAALTGNGVKEILTFKDKGDSFTSTANTVIIGARSLDTKEKQHLKNCGVTVFSMQSIDQSGITELVSQAIEIAGKNTKGIYLSFDIDSIDPSIAPGVSTPVSGGLTYREAHVLCEMMSKSQKLIGIDIVEHNPLNDQKNATGKLAVELISSLLGKVIY